MAKDKNTEWGSAEKKLSIIDAIVSRKGGKAKKELPPSDMASGYAQMFEPGRRSDLEQQMRDAFDTSRRESWMQRGDAFLGDIMERKQQEQEWMGLGQGYLDDIYTARGDDYLDQPGGYLSQAARGIYDALGGEMMRDEYERRADIQDSWRTYDIEQESAAQQQREAYETRGDAMMRDEYERRADTAWDWIQATRQEHGLMSQTDIDRYEAMGDDYLDQPGGYMSKATRRGYEDAADAAAKAIREQRQKEIEDYYRRGDRMYDDVEKEKKKERERKQKEREKYRKRGDAWYDDIEKEKEKKAKRIRDINYEILGDEWVDPDKWGGVAGAGYLPQKERDKYDKKADAAYEAIEKQRKKEADRLDKRMGDAQRDYRLRKEKYGREGDAFLKSEINSLKEQYTRLGTQMRSADAITRQQLMQQRNALLEEGKRYAADLNLREIPNTFPWLEPTSDIARTAELAQKGVQGQVAGQLLGQAGRGSFYKRGELFRGTSYASTGAINGVMKALAGIFILFVFIGVFYMVFGPIYDSMIHNFTIIVAADGDATLGGKSIPVLFDNVAKVVLVWVPLIVFAGALYKLTALVFEREVGTRTTEETEWDMLGAIEDSTDLDMGSDPSVFEAYGGGY